MIFSESTKYLSTFLVANKSKDIHSYILIIANQNKYMLTLKFVYAIDRAYLVFGYYFTHTTILIVLLIIMSNMIIH